jgi:hypothetical protein
MIAVVCFLYPAIAIAAEGRNWDIYCISGGDCAFYDPDACGAAAPPSSDANVASMDISDIAKKYDLQSAIVEQQGGGVVGAYKSDDPPASPASTMKLVIVDTLLQEGVNLNKSIRVTDEVLYDGTNDLGVSSITVKDAITKTLQNSSNVGANVLMKAMGGVDEFTSKAHSHGYKKTTVKAYYSSSAMGLNKSSIGDQADAMDHIFSGGSPGYGIAQSALQSGDDHYGVGGKARKWAGNSLVAGSVAMFHKDGNDYIVGVYYEGNFETDKAVNAVRNGTADLVTKIGKSGAIVSGKAVGNLPPGGKNVGASYYSGATGYKGDKLPGTWSYAELGDGTGMGGLNHKQKLAITYKGKTVVAEKLDVGAGGDDVNGKPRLIDLYQNKTANFLGLDSEGVGVVHVQGVDKSTPLGPVAASDLESPSDGGESESACCPDTGSTSHAGNAASDHGTWNSGLKPPYILEQWAIEVLKDIAAKMKVDESDTVTKEHVIALIAFAMGEGGDIMNDDIFNPLNTGLDAPELIDGSHDVSGVQSFKSFDAGVEAVARTMVGSYQDRLADILIKPASTAKQFMYALTYFNKYPGNALWAGASVDDPAGYYQGRLDLINQVRDNYKGTAGLIIGTSHHEQAENMTKPELLQFSGGGGADTDGGGGACDSGTSADAAGIVTTALKLAWPDASHGTTPKPEYKQAINKYNKGMNPADCGVFVATVMRASGADPNYPPVGTAVQEQYVRSHPNKYDVVNKVNKISDLEPGDILIVNSGSGEGAAGHTYIFIGKQPGGFNAASASLNSRAGNLGDAVLGDGRGDYLRARLK